MAPRFLPFIGGEPIILRDDELDWTAKYRSGCFAVHDGQIGISFKSVNSRMLWSVNRKYFKGSEIGVFEKTPTAKEISSMKSLCCDIPVNPGTFQPLTVPSDQAVVLRKLLRITDLIESLIEAESQEYDDIRSDRLRSELNETYDDFVNKYGILANCKSYFNGIFYDIRLEIFLSGLEDAAVKADIFTKRLQHPPRKVQGQQFFEADLDLRIANAFAWSMGWYGGVDVEAIAEISGLSSDFVEESLLRQGLVYREWIGLANKNWWEVLGVDQYADMIEVKIAYRKKVRLYHPDVNPSPAATLLMQQINAAYEKAEKIAANAA